MHGELLIYHPASLLVLLLLVKNQFKWDGITYPLGVKVTLIDRIKNQQW